MELICKIVDEDIGEVSIKMDNPRLWETPKKALKLITESYDKLIASKYKSVYHTKFVVLRDRKILEKYIEMEN